MGIGRIFSEGGVGGTKEEGRKLKHSTFNVEGNGDEEGPVVVSL
jgi:hypothetical protein